MPALIVYAMGVSALMLTDVIVTSSMNEAQVAQWADVRAMFGILAAFLNLGMETVIVRNPAASRKLLRAVGVQYLLLSVPTGYFAHQLGYLSDSWVAVLLALGAAGTVLQGQYFRSHNAFLFSQIFQQFWRVGAIVIILVYVFLPDIWPYAIDATMAWLIFGSACLGWCLLTMSPHKRPNYNDPIVPQYAISMRFFATGIIANVALFGEQLIVNGLGTSNEAAIYFTHMTYFLFPVSVIAAFVAFRLGPWMRDNPNQFVYLYRKHKPLIFVSVMIGVGLIHGVGWLGWIMVAPHVGSPVPFLQIVFYCAAVLRTFYILPSAHNGMFSKPRQHDVLIVVQFAMLFILGGMLFALSSKFEIVYLVAVLGLLNWVIRIVVSFSVMDITIKQQGHDHVVKVR